MSSGTGPCWPTAARAPSTRSMPMPVRWAGGMSAQVPAPRVARWAGAGSPGAGRAGTSWSRYWGRALPPRYAPAPYDVSSRAAGAGRRDRVVPHHRPRPRRRHQGQQRARRPWATILPDVSGRSVLDIGAWDGKFSFLCEQSGASRVVALDHYAWGVDFVARGAYWAECIHKGTFADQSRDETDFWRPDLPGKRGFDLAEGRARVPGRVGGGRLPERSTSTRWDSSTSCSTWACSTT